ncbi:FAD-dependent oxidoreductase [Paracoccus bogoriensis]|uniref:FAD-dependent oxidoreductase n=1 Tax=Paracoccus bogoriensis TaxID=242065 RepID=UPI001CA5A962|nr:FAD-dependent oxidoreductase [Paracoccus bogoriensis]MBW7055980.1 FAD-dependent oxidoreductase [Paracoccus bogoriensis]
MRIILLGGGHAHIGVLRLWAARPSCRPRGPILLADPGSEVWYSGMLPGHVAGHYPARALMIDLPRLCDRAAVTRIEAAADAVDPVRRRVRIGGAWHDFDLLSLDIGAHARLDALPGFSDHALAVKPLGTFSEGWARWLAKALPAPRVAVIGAGLGGAEIALAMAHRLGPDARVTLIEGDAQPLPGLGARARAMVVGALERRGIGILTGSAVARVEADALHLADGRIEGADLIVGAAGARPHGWLAVSGLTDARGFVPVGPTLQHPEYPHILAVGDCAEMLASPRPKAGVHAVRQGPDLAHNLAALVAGRPPRPHHPQRDFLKLVSLGERRAIALWRGLALGGAGGSALLWRLKDRIDRGFMARGRC